MSHVIIKPVVIKLSDLSDICTFGLILKALLQNQFDIYLVERVVFLSVCFQSICILPDYEKDLKPVLAWHGSYTNCSGCATPLLHLTKHGLEPRSAHPEQLVYEPCHAKTG